MDYYLISIYKTREMVKAELDPRCFLWKCHI